MTQDQIDAMIGMNVDEVVYAINLRVPPKAVTPIAKGSEVMADLKPDPWRIYVVYDADTHDVLDIHQALEENEVSDERSEIRPA